MNSSACHDMNSSLLDGNKRSFDVNSSAPDMNSDSWPDFEERSGFFFQLARDLRAHISLEEKPFFCLALSGGIDSLVLFTFLVWLRHMENLPFLALHFNHGLRGDTDAEESQFIRELCVRYAVPLREGRADVRALAAERGAGLEEAARFARHRFFDEELASVTEKLRLQASFRPFTEDRQEEPLKSAAALKQSRPRSFTVSRQEKSLESPQPPVFLVLGHHLNDRAETIILQMTRGTGLKGLCAMPYRDGSKLRPLLLTERSRIEAFARESGLLYCEDESNFEDDFLRNRVRHQLLPLWQDISERPLYRQLSDLAENLEEENALLEDEARAALDRLLLGSGALNLKALLQLHPGLYYRVISLWLAKALNAGPSDELRVLPRKTWLSLRKKLEELPTSAQFDLPGGRRLLLRDFRLELEE